MDYEIYDPKKHGGTVAPRSLWRDLFEKADSARPNGMVVHGSRSAVSSMAKRWGYKHKTRTLADGSGFVLWAEKLP